MHTVKKIKTMFSYGEIKNDILKSAAQNFPEKGLIIAWTDEGIYWGYKDEDFVFYQSEAKDMISKRLIFLRLFNTVKELYIWKRQDAFQKRYFSRIRIDGDGDESPVIDTRQLIWGTHAKRLDNGFYSLTEPRNIKLIVPHIDATMANIDLAGISPRKRLYILTRNYIAYYPETGQAYFVDVRFVNTGIINGGAE